MTEKIPLGLGSNEYETKGRFYDLFRARELYIQLFRDSSPLINLGYTAAQIELAKPVLSLLEGEGKVATYLPNNPFLAFNREVGSDSLELEVYSLTGTYGFDLSARKDWDQSFGDWIGLSEEERFERIFHHINESENIFDDYPAQVAQIALFEENARIYDLDFLMHQLLSDLFSDTLLGMQNENTLTSAARNIGMVGTYRALWTDETRYEFVAKLDFPGNNDFDSQYVAYRRLNPVSDSKGKMIPFGKKANISQDNILKILKLKKQKEISGQIISGNLDI
jgi:hypothetical protein